MTKGPAKEVDQPAVIRVFYIQLIVYVGIIGVVQVRIVFNYI